MQPPYRKILDALVRVQGAPRQVAPSAFRSAAGQQIQPPLNPQAAWRAALPRTPDARLPTAAVQSLLRTCLAARALLGRNALQRYSGFVQRNWPAPPLLRPGLPTGPPGPTTGIGRA